ncbi:MAG TPA: hypothetical protein VMF65_09375 [Acidimicrobiales bacterium]|nr:hypothetical protein [Acidimicrobiales bacterium]
MARWVFRAAGRVTGRGGVLAAVSVAFARPGVGASSASVLRENGSGAAEGRPASFEPSSLAQVGPRVKWAPPSTH